LGSISEELESKASNIQSPHEERLIISAVISNSIVYANMHLSAISSTRQWLPWFIW